MLSIRCFTKYGDYIHWSGYQLSGRQIRFESVDDHSLKDACGSSTPFPRLTEMHKLETSLIFQPARKTDIQVCKQNSFLLCDIVVPLSSWLYIICSVIV